MKTLLKPLFALVLATIAFTSCMKDNTEDNEAEYLRQEKAIDSLLSAQKTKIEDYVHATSPETDKGWQEDTITMTFPRLAKTVKRGIWYEVLAEPTEEDDEAYEYKVQSNGYGYYIVAPTNVKLKYAVYSLDSETPLKEDATGGDYNFTSTNTNLTYAWVFGFYPYTVSQNGENINFHEMAGLTEKGLKKGSKIRIVIPSYWLINPATNGSTTTDYLPTNAPVVYEFEVLSIQ